MRAPFQVLVIPYLLDGDRPFYCILKRSDAYYWHFIAGGGEDDETPAQAALRQARQEIGASDAGQIFPLEFSTYVPAAVVSEKHRQHWPAGTYLLPELYFAIRLESNAVKLSHEHTEFCWVAFDQAISLLHWQSNTVGLYELNERIKRGDWKVRG